MRNLFLIDVKRKLETQDIFRAKTVRSLVSMLDSAEKENERLENKILYSVEKLEKATGCTDNNRPLEALVRLAVSQLEELTKERNRLKRATLAVNKLAMKWSQNDGSDYAFEMASAIATALEEK